MKPNSQVDLFDCDFDTVTMSEAVAQCVSWCQGPRRAHTVLTANAAILCMKRRDPELEQACAAANLVVPDGMPVVWASRLAGSPLPERVAGVDFMVELLRAASEHGLRVYFMGAKYAVVHSLAEYVRLSFPGAVIAGYRDGYFRPEQHEDVVEEIRATKPDILFVGMPSPFKETWCEKHRERLDVPVIMGVGGSFDVLTGYVKRAPVLLQKIGMEWSWRLAMEPRKMWKRYLTTNTEFLWLAAQQVAQRRIADVEPAVGGAR
jgi:N-acetylglucosaminyldiphosphoundecaprenol N-acetyl-beta-D-mannosaminyltransferase